MIVDRLRPGDPILDERGTVSLALALCVSKLCLQGGDSRFDLGDPSLDLRESSRRLFASGLLALVGDTGLEPMTSAV